MADNKRSRSANTTAVEREMILQLVQKYQDVIENKRTDAVTSAHKEKVWQRIATEFNAVGINKKDSKQLKTVYENMKAKAKKALSADKVERFRTGGGIFKPTVDSVDEQLLALMGNRATPLENLFDSDNGYNNLPCKENTNEQIIPQSVPQIGSVDNCEEVMVGDTIFRIVRAQLDDMPASTSTAAASCQIQEIQSIDELQIQLIQSADCAAHKEPSSVPAKLSAIVKDIEQEPYSKKWSTKKNLKSGKQKTFVDTSSKIQLLADEQSKYYKRKLEMEEEEHAVRMELYALKKKRLLGLQNVNEQ